MEKVWVVVFISKGILYDLLVTDCADLAWEVQDEWMGSERYNENEDTVDSGEYSITKVSQLTSQFLKGRIRKQ